MDTQLAAVVHKENLNIGRGKATVKTVKKERKALADLTRLSNGANLKSKSALLGSFEDRNAPSDHIVTDEIEEMGGYSWSAKDEENLLMNQTLSEIMASAIGVPISELEEAVMSDEEGYETDGSDLNVSISVPGRLSSLYTPEELDDPLGVVGIVLEEYPLPELKLDDDYREFSIDNYGGIDGTQSFGSIRAAI